MNDEFEQFNELMRRKLWSNVWVKYMEKNSADPYPSSACRRATQVADEALKDFDERFEK